MSHHHAPLPQLSDRIFITDGGLETRLLFHNQIDLPEFASYVLLKTEEGCAALYDYYALYADLARAAG